eukprot:1601670-Rhodomonas_salina.2
MDLRARPLLAGARATLCRRTAACSCQDERRGRRSAGKKARQGEREEGTQREKKERKVGHNMQARPHKKRQRRKCQSRSSGACVLTTSMTGGKRRKRTGRIV